MDAQQGRTHVRDAVGGRDVFCHLIYRWGSHLTNVGNRSWPGWREVLIKAHGDSIHARRILERGRKPSPESRHHVQK